MFDPFRPRLFFLCALWLGGLAFSMFSRNCFLFWFFLLAGCASVVDLENVGSQVDRGWLEGDGSSTVLVVGYAYDPEKRSAFEQEMVLALRARGISAVASGGRLPDLRSVTETVLSDFLQASPDAAVLLVRALSVTQEHSRGVQDGAVHALFVDDALDWDVSTGAQLEASLYVHGRDAFVWREWTQLGTRNAIGSKALSAFANHLLQSMIRDGVADRL